MRAIRVVVADDSLLAREMLRGFLEEAGGFEVVAEAANGREAVEFVRALRPDVLTLDLEMPVLGGMEAIDEIMSTRAVPILVVSGVADASTALESVRRGALDFVEKPTFSPEAAAAFIAKVRLLAGVSVITRLRPRPEAPGPLRPGGAVRLPHPPATSKNAAPALVPRAASYGRVIAIASSTGGPQVLAQILPALPAGFSCPVLVAQHISDGFAEGLAKWLDTLCRLPVVLAAEGELLAPGTVYVSPSERHLTVGEDRRLALKERRPTDLYRPSCDALLSSVGSVFGRAAVGIILTGMGSDGVEGLSVIRRAGGATLGQDEASSVIYGMNRVAVDRGVVQRVLPAGELAGAMVDFAGRAPLDASAGWA